MHCQRLLAGAATGAGAGTGAGLSCGTVADVLRDNRLFTPTEALRLRVRDMEVLRRTVEEERLPLLLLPPLLLPLFREVRPRRFEEEEELPSGRLDRLRRGLELPSPSPVELVLRGLRRGVGDAMALLARRMPLEYDADMLRGGPLGLRLRPLRLRDCDNGDAGSCDGGDGGTACVSGCCIAKRISSSSSSSSASKSRMEL